MSEHEKPWWFPEPTDEAYASRLREDYPEKAHMDDDELIEYFSDGQRYATTWDHVGDAYSEYEPLADFLFEVLDVVKRLSDGERSDDGHTALRDAARAALFKIGG